MLDIDTSLQVDRAAETLRFLSDRNRLRILTALTRAETCVCDLIDELGLPQPLVSYHLGKMRAAGLVRARREAQWIYYSLDPIAWDALMLPVSEILSLSPLPETAHYGASRRCDAIPPDPARGASRDEADGC